MGKGTFPLHFKCTFLILCNQKVSGEEEDEGKEPSWEKQEAMVRRLQKKFPDQDKEVKTHRHLFSPVPFTLSLIVVHSDFTLYNCKYSADNCKVAV